ncbi:Translin family protein [Quillaja saponaria]|uniref:Translin family protein n=1 Tax=Quillaja saponaria TaxID=32244 RepID=A0AAD7Q059_QUISA|nr:Translin family protein [Quillaja saponaria]
MKYMKSAFRNAHFTISRFLNPNPLIPSILDSVPSLPTIRVSPSFLRPRFSVEETFRFLSQAYFPSFAMAGGDHPATTSFESLEKQFEDFRMQLEESGGLGDRIRAVVLEIESTIRLMHASLLLVHQSRPTPELLEKAKTQIPVLKELYNRLAEVHRECPGRYYRHHGDWRSQTQSVVSLLTFMHWIETGSLLMHLDIEEKLGCVCFMSNELPRYVVNQVIAGDYDCPRKVLKFLTDLHAAFLMLNLRNDFLRKKFDGMKDDLRRVEEVYYDVKIRALVANGELNGDRGTQG